VAGVDKQGASLYNSRGIGSGKKVVFKKYLLGSCSYLNEVACAFFVNKSVVGNPELMRGRVAQALHSVADQVAIGGGGTLFNDISNQYSGAAIGKVYRPTVYGSSVSEVVEQDKIVARPAFQLMSFSDGIQAKVIPKDQAIDFIDVHIVLVARVGGATIVIELIVFQDDCTVRIITTKDAHFISDEKAIPHNQITSFLPNSGSVVVGHSCQGEFYGFDGDSIASNNKKCFSVAVIGECGSSFQSGPAVNAPNQQVIFTEIDLGVVGVQRSIDAEGITVGH
jgi:hypothetical protein